MIKKTNNWDKQFGLTPLAKEIKHICEQLYKIKSINRKNEYTVSELQSIVFNHRIGKKVIKELRAKKVTALYLEFWGQTLLSDVLGEKLDKYEDDFES